MFSSAAGLVRLTGVPGYLEGGNDVFGELDDCFYKQSEDLNALIVDYARKHEDEFTEPSKKIVAKFKRKNQIVKYYFGKTKPG